LKDLLGAALHDVQQPRRTGAGAHRGQVDDHRDVLPARAGMTPDVFVDADDVHAVEAVLIGDQQRPPFGEHGAVRGVCHATPSAAAT